MNWYVVRAISGKEKKAKEYLDIEIKRLNMSLLIPQVIVPTERVVQIRNGKKTIKEKNILKPTGSVRIEDGDQVVLFALSDDVREVERLLQVTIDFF